MRISHKHKFVFVSVPKTGSETIRQVLNPFSDIKSKFEPPYDHHAKSKELREHFNKKGWDWNTYYKFAFVRNPWSLTVSLYFFQRDKVDEWSNMENPPTWDGFKENFDMFKRQMDRCPTFEDYVNMLNNCPHVHLQSEWMTANNSNKNIIDYVGRFENLQEDFDLICDKIGIPQQQLPRKNKSKHKHYTEYYDDETRQIVEKLHAKDIEMFGYEFEE
jgi:hypothetical protein